MKCEQIRENLEAYSVGALEPAEEAEVEQHLAACPDCQQLAAEFSEIVSQLPPVLAAVSAVRPPADLKQRLLRQIAPNDPATTNFVATTTPTPSRRASSSRLRSFGGRSWATVGLALLILLFVAVVLGTRLSNVLAQERALRAELAYLFGQQEVVLEVIDSDKTTRRVLLPPERTSAELPPYGKLFTRSDLPHVVAMIARLPAPPPDRAYHLWLTYQGQTELAGLMTVNEEGFSLLVFDADQDGPPYEQVQLTLQAPGSPTPAGEVILQWEIAEE